MSDLTRFRDHCRAMAGPPVAPGSSAARDRALWLMLADEVDRYLSAPEEPALFAEEEPALFAEE